MPDEPSSKPVLRIPPGARLPVVLIATGLGLGKSRILPGTLGTLLGLPLAWAMGQLPTAAFVAVELVLIAVGVPLCHAAARVLGKKDPSEVVYDEYVALPVALFLIPVTWTTLLIAFVLHRVFDITKLWPISAAERLPGGWGIMADDLVAAVFANVVIHALAAGGWV